MGSGKSEEERREEQSMKRLMMALFIAARISTGHARSPVEDEVKAARDLAEAVLKTP